MSDQIDTLRPFMKKLNFRGALSVKDQQAVLALPHVVAEFSPAKQLVRQGEEPRHCSILLDGFAFRYKVLLEGRRSICAVHIMGDIVDLQNSLLGTPDYGVQTLTQCLVAFIPREEILRLAFKMPNIGKAIWSDSLVEASMCREWIANVGRRDAAGRLSHLLCEFGVRREAAGLGNRESYELPMTQEQLADATGLTQVHVNRMLRELEERGLITRGQKSVRVEDWNGLAAEGAFSEAYLHLGGLRGRFSQDASLEHLGFS